MTVRASSAEDELILRLARVRAARTQDVDILLEKSREVSYERLEQRLYEHRLISTLGPRLIDLGAPVPAAFAATVAEATSAGRHRAGVQALHTANLCRRLDDAGIPALTLKGAPLAERIYTDAGMRAPSRDIDLLVDQRQFDDAVRVLAELNYSRVDEVNWTRGLPHYHVALHSPNRSSPLIELHWRVHWYETEYASRVLERSRPDPTYARRPDPIDDLTLLLLIWARDGFYGLRLAADIAAWWDAHGHTLPPHALDAILERHPRLAQALLASARFAEGVLGVPTAALFSAHHCPKRRAQLALRFANWDRRGEGQDVANAITLVDLLLTPPAAAPVFVRHYWLQPLGAYETEYGWNPRSRAFNHIRRAAHVIVRALRGSARYLRELWRIRGNRTLAPLPPLG